MSAHSAHGQRVVFNYLGSLHQGLMHTCIIVQEIMSENLIVRVATSPEDLTSVLALTKEESWRTIGNCDHELFYAADTKGFFTGFIKEEKVSYISMVTYRSSRHIHCIFGTFLVYPEHRKQGKGYGAKTWEYAWSKIPKGCTSISVTAAQHMAPKFQEKYGFEPAWTDYMFLFDTQQLSSNESSSVTITSYGMADFNNFLDYDASVFGYTRKVFLEKLLALSECEGWVAMDEDGQIVGYCAVRESVVEKCWVLGPWYANNVIIARLLLTEAANFVSRLYQDNSVRLVCVMPGINVEGMKLARSLTKETAGFVRMFAKSKPEIIVTNSEKRVFGVSSACIG